MHTASGGNDIKHSRELSPSFYLGLLPVLLLIICVISFRLFLHTVVVFEPNFLLPAFNTFLFLASSVIAYIALTSYLLNGASTVLWLGCGVLTLGTGALAAGWLITPFGPNVNVTIFNVAVLLASICHTGAILATLEGKAREPEPGRRRRKATLGYLAVLTVVTLLVWLTVAGLMPRFFIQGQGPTVIRQYVVEWAIVLFIFSSLVIMHRFLRQRASFLYWYSLALALVALSMVAFFLQPAVGSPIGWVGRTSYVIAAIYFLISVSSALREARTRRVGLNAAMAELLGPGLIWQEILGAVSDAVVSYDERGRILLWNKAAERIFGFPEAEVIGKGLDLILPDRKAIYALSLSGGITEIALKRQNGSGFSAEVSLSGQSSSLGMVATLIIRDISARKQADAALRESEKHYRSLFDNMLNGFAYCQLLLEDNRPVDFIFLNVNHAFEILTGLTKVTGKKASEVIPSLRESDPQIFEIFGRVASTGKPERFETYVKAMEMWFSISVYSPQREHFVAIFDVITRRKQAEAALKRQHAILAGINRVFREALTCETEEQLGETCLAVAQELTGSKFGFIGELNKEANLNDLAITYLGWEACKIPGTKELVLPKNLHVHGIYGVCLREGVSEIANDPASHPESIGVPKGHPPIKAFLGVPLIHGGKTIGMIGLANKEGGYSRADQEAVEALAVAVVEAFMRKRAEEEVRRHASFPQMYPSPVIEIDAAGAVTLYNQAAVEVLEKIGPDAKLSDLLPEDLGEINTAARQKQAKVFYREARIKDKVFGQNIYFAESFDVLRIYSLDITERQRAKEKLTKAMADLARTNQDLEEFAYVASHDLQEPLRKMASFSEILAKRYQGQLDERADKYLGYIVDGAQRMKTLINDLLVLSRVGRTDLNLISTDMNDILKKTLNDIQHLVRENRAEITHEPLPTLKVNPPQMGQLLQNLITNAIKFHGDQSPRIHLTARQDGQEWLMAVRDNGIGFDPHFAKRIFKVFQRLHTKEEYPGTGIGLAICKKIVERHGGRIWAESEPGQGTTFYFSIPA